MNAQTIILLGKVPSAEALDAFDKGEAPRPEFYLIAKKLGAQIVGPNAVNAAKFGPFAKLVAGNYGIAAAMAAVSMRNTVRRVYTTGEDIGFKLLLLLNLLGWSGRLHMVVHACTSLPRKAFVSLMSSKKLGGYICVSSEQTNILLATKAVKPDRARFFYNWVDTKYFDPARATTTADRDYIFACGLENRDYGTLEKAARLLPHKFVVQASGFFDNTSADSATLPANFSVNKSRLPYSEIRDLYANSRFVVVPLNPVAYAAGVTGMLEAMAMGKAVIVTASPGMRDYTTIDSVVTVPAYDETALSNAIAKLWASPELCAELGEKNRRWVEAHASVDDYAEQVAKLMA